MRGSSRIGIAFATQFSVARTSLSYPGMSILFRFRLSRSKSKRAFADALAQFATVVRAFLCPQFFWQRFFRARFADRVKPEVRDRIVGCQRLRVVVIEAFLNLKNQRRRVNLTALSGQVPNLHL